ncbi:MAG: alpha/beta hydrolase [Planctomycetes bacterium]|nr:alpha/beta hydrolase [Planctomycetota bacterium]
MTLLLVGAVFSAVLTPASCQNESDAAQKIAIFRESAQQQEIQFKNGHDLLAGTLYSPASKTNAPAVVLLAGSDRSKRGGLKNFIAKYFADHGIAALTYDSPGTGASSGNALLQTSADRVAEALSAVTFLKRQKGIQPQAVGIFGGSEGANIALLAGANSDEVGFVIPVSGSLGVSILDVLRYSAEKKGYAEGLSPQQILQVITFKELAFALLSGVELVEWSLLEDRVKSWNDANWSEFLGAVRQRQTQLIPEQKESLLASLRKIIPAFTTQPWFEVVDVGNSVQRLLALDAATFFGLLESGRFSQDWVCDLTFSADQLRCPVLAIWGAEDSFLPPNQSAARLKKYFADTKHPDSDVIVFANASHYLTKPSSPKDFVPDYLETMADWINHRF